MLRPSSLAVLLALLAAPAAADEVAPPRPAPDLLAVLNSDQPSAARAEAAAELARLGAAAIPALEQHLGRSHQSSPDQRREVLHRIHADVPDAKGNFKTPKRASEEEKEAKKRGEVDWLPALLELAPDSPAVRETVSDVAAIRALAAAHDPRAGEVVFGAAFDSSTMVYRDECGRYLRNMVPYSLPVLIAKAAIDKKYSTERRYATYQLERLDLEHPAKALRAVADDEQFTAVVLRTYGENHERTAVDTVLAHANDESPVVRQAARDAWMMFVTGPEPKPAPKRKLQLRGGELSDKEQPLWLTYREMAEVALDRSFPEVLQKDRPRRQKLADSSRELFDHWDQQRTLALGARIDAALARAATDTAAAAAELDAVLALQPDHPRRAEMAPVFLDRAHQLGDAGDFAAAAAAYAKANALDPGGEHAEDALASHYYMLAKAREAAGKDPGPFLERARQVQPTPSAETRALAGDRTGRSSWMLYAGIGGGLGAVLLLALGLIARRNHQHAR